MAKPRGRPPLPANKRKQVQLSVRLRRETEKRLIASANANGHTLSQEITERLEASLMPDAKVPALWGGQKNYSFALLLALTLKELREQTGHWWHEDPFTFEHANTAATVLFEFVRPRGRSRIPADLPPARPGNVRRVSMGMPHRNSDFGAEAAHRMIEAVDAYCGSYGRKMEELLPTTPAQSRDAHQFTLGLYRQIGRALLPLHVRSRPRLRTVRGRK
jgi:hypothetical protein